MTKQEKIEQLEAMRNGAMAYRAMCNNLKVMGEKFRRTNTPLIRIETEDGYAGRARWYATAEGIIIEMYSVVEGFYLGATPVDIGTRFGPVDVGYFCYSDEFNCVVGYL